MKEAMLAAVAVALLIVLAAVSAAGASSHGSTRKTLRFTAVSKEFTPIDQAPSGFSQGDELAFRDVWKSNGSVVGHSGGTCTITSVKHPEGFCFFAVMLPGGEITYQGLFTPPQFAPGGTAVFAVVGGTGAYENVAGEVIDHALNETVTRLTLRLS